jgi:hypothetical protein
VSVNLKRKRKMLKAQPDTFSCARLSSGFENVTEKTKKTIRKSSKLKTALSGMVLSILPNRLTELKFSRSLPVRCSPGPRARKGKKANKEATILTSAHAAFMPRKTATSAPLTCYIIAV